MGHFFPYLGGKTALIPSLLQLIPEHRVYVEVFGGSAELLLRKPRSAREVYNDVDGNLVNLFLQTRDRYKELKKRLDLLPYSRLIYGLWMNEFKQGRGPRDPLERAARYYYVLCSQFAGKMWGGWAYDRGLRRRYWGKRRLRVIRLVHNRLQGVSLECKDFRDLIQLYDAPDVFFYLDPPYMAKTGYTSKFGEEEHRQLAEALEGVRGRWLLTIGDHPLMRELYDRKIFTAFTQGLTSEKLVDGESRRRLVSLIVSNFLLPGQDSGRLAYGLPIMVF